MALSLTEARSRLAFLNGQLSGIAKSMRAALARNDGATLETLRRLYKKLHEEAATFRAQINEAEMPGEFMQQLAKFSADVDDVAAGLGAIPQGIGAAFKSLPLILGAVAVLAVVGAFLYLRRRG